MKNIYHQVLKNTGPHRWGNLFLILLALLVLSGCKQGTPSSFNAWVTQSTLNPTEAVTPAPSFVLPTVTAIPGPQTAEPIHITTELFTHPDGLFSLQAPQDWAVSQASEGLDFSDPQGGQDIAVRVVNTGYALDDESFARFVEMLEQSNAEQFENYIETERKESAEDSAVLIRKSFAEGGLPKTGVSYYQASEHTLVVADFRADENQFPLYQALFEEVYSSIQLNQDAAAALSVYSYDPANIHENGYFSISIPLDWDFRRVEEGNSVVETFTSPDEQAVIQTLVYDDGERMTRTIAGELTLSLLRENYTTKIRISSDEVLPDGREKITWNALDNTYQGITAFSTQDTALYLLTVMWGSDPDGYYQDLLDQVFGSFNPDNSSD